MGVAWQFWKQEYHLYSETSNKNVFQWNCVDVSPANLFSSLSCICSNVNNAKPICSSYIIINTKHFIISPYMELTCLNGWAICLKNLLHICEKQ